MAHSSVIQPITGQFDKFFGCHHISRAVVAMSTLGIHRPGDTSSVMILITCRAVQGAGSGGIVIVTGMVTSDVFSLAGELLSISSR